MNENDNRPFVVHLRAEHRAIRNAVADVEAALQLHSDAKVKRRVRRLLAVVASHFEEEECDGCADEAVARTPGLSSEATAICHEHQALTRDLRDLVDTVGGTEWPDAFHQLGIRLETHLTREARLVEAGLNVDRELESFE